jgi:hypothetical protein
MLHEIDSATQQPSFLRDLGCGGDILKRWQDCDLKYGKTESTKERTRKDRKGPLSRRKTRRAVGKVNLRNMAARASGQLCTVGERKHA